MMKIIVASIIVVSNILLVAVAVHANDVYLDSHTRLWTSAGGGHKTRAKLLNASEDDQNVVLLKAEDGKEINVAFERLSKEDQQFVHGIRGRFLRVSKDGKRVTLRMANGSQREFPVMELTKASQEYVRKRHGGEMPPAAKKAEEKPGSARSLTGLERGLTVVPSTPTANTFVLLIGINKYPGDVPSLNYCVADTEGLAQSLKDAGVPAEHIIVMVDDAKDVSRRPSRSNIERQIELVTGLVKKNDLLLVAFSGHGLQVNDEAYLCPNDMDVDRQGSFLPRKWLYERIERCSAQKKLVIMDACRNEIDVKWATRSVIGVRSLADPLGDMDSRGFATLASCSQGQKSYEDEKLKHGVFTFYIMQGLTGAADADRDGRVTFEELYGYVSDSTRRHVLKTYQRPQVPMRGGEFSGDFVLTTLGKHTSVKPLVSSPPTVPAPVVAAAENTPENNQAVSLEDATRENGFDSTSYLRTGLVDFVRYGSNSLKTGLDAANAARKKVDKFDDAAIAQANAAVTEANANIKKKQKEIAQTTYYFDYPYSISSSKNHDNGKSSLKMWASVQARFVKVPAGKKVECPSHDAVGTTFSSNMNYGGINADISGGTSDIGELVHGKDKYRIRVWYKNLRYDDKSYTTADVLKIEIVKTGTKP